MPPKKELTMRPSFGVFAFLSALAFNPSAHAESYSLPGESSPAAEELIGSPGCRLSGTSRVQPLLGDRSVNSLGFRKRPQSTSKWLGRSLYGGLRPLWFALQSRPEAKRLFC